jgi:flagella basal body P-ring formation protein FlgA
MMILRRIYSRSVLLVAACAAILVSVSAFAETPAWSPEAEIKAFLKSNYPWAETEVNLLNASSVQPGERPAAIAVEKTPPGNAMFRFDFRNAKSVSVTALVKAFDRVIVTRSALHKGTVLSDTDTYETLMETNRIPKGALHAGARVSGKPLTRGVVANAVLTDAMISDTPLVKRGSKVLLSVEAPGFSIRTSGLTRQDAAVGESVAVENLGSKRIVTGLLVDEGSVRVEY